MESLYPLKFKTIFKDKIWGGNKIKTLLGKDFNPLPNCGETWELSGVEGNISKVKDGQLSGIKLTELINTYKGDLVGAHVYEKFGSEFPLLLKFIDANDDLSIQVHPDDTLAKERHNSFGKTEMWYVVDAEKEASLISGFNQPVTKESYVESFEGGKLTEILNREAVVTDDVFFLPAGRVHTIGKGLLIAEIQQTSDVTYRIYDFDRVDDHGKSRELHVEEALDAIDYNFYPEYKTKYDSSASETTLVSCEYFTTNKLQVSEVTQKDYSGIDSCIILMCLKGEGTIAYDNGQISYELGDTILIPNVLSNITLEPSDGSTFLEVMIP